MHFAIKIRSLGIITLAILALAGEVSRPRFFEIHRLAAFTARITSGFALVAVNMDTNVWDSVLKDLCSRLGR